MNNLASLRKEKGLTQKDVADYLGISRQAYANYEAQNREPDINTLKSLSEFFGVTIDYILGNESSRAKIKGVKIPVYGKVAAGIPMEAITDIEDYEEITEDLARTGEFAALKIKGDSMEPRMMEGDVVIVRIQNTIENGEIAVVMVNGDAATCKKIKKTPEGVMLVPINPSHEPMFYSNKEIEQLPVRIFGKVVELRAKFR
jgi:repressor LexA